MASCCGLTQLLTKHHTVPLHIVHPVGWQEENWKSECEKTHGLR